MNTTSNNVNIVAYYNQLSQLLYATICLVEAVIGIIGSILGFIVFAQKTMRQNPASVYFITFNINNFFYLRLDPLALAIQRITKYSLISNNIYYCKIYSYTGAACAAISRYTVVLASIDRTLVTSSNALMRKRSTHRLAHKTISVMIFLVGIFYAHVFVGYNIYQIVPGTNTCIPTPHLYSDFHTYSNFTISCVIPILLMIIFAIKTMKNLSQVRLQPVNTALTPVTKKQFRDRQLTILLLVEVAFYVCFVPWGAAFNIYIQYTQYAPKSAQQRAIEQFVVTIFVLLVFLPPAISFYQNLIVSKAFRQKAVQVFFHRCQRRPIDNGNQYVNSKSNINRSNYQ